MWRNNKDIEMKKINAAVDLLREAGYTLTLSTDINTKGKGSKKGQTSVTPRPTSQPPGPTSQPPGPTSQPPELIFRPPDHTGFVNSNPKVLVVVTKF